MTLNFPLSARGILELEQHKSHAREFGRELTNGTGPACLSIQTSANEKRCENQDPDPRDLKTAQSTRNDKAPSVQMGDAQKLNSSFNSSQQPLKRAKQGTGLGAGKPLKPDEAKGKKVVKPKPAAPTQLKNSGSLPPLKAAENPETEQLQVFVEEEETETTVQDKTEEKSEFAEVTAAEQEPAPTQKVNEQFKERLAQYKKTLQKQLNF